MSSARKLQRQQLGSRSKPGGVHSPHQARADDPPVVHCADCDAITVVRENEEPHCAKCNAKISECCKGNFKRTAN